MGIKHIEDLSETQLQSLTSNWNNKNVVVTEKIDGCHMVFGVKDNKFYLGSKNLTFKNYLEIPQVYFYDDFRKYFKELCQIPLAVIFENLNQKHQLNVDIQLEGEAIPDPDFNIIRYNRFEIGAGVFVLFKTLTDNEAFWNDLVTELNKYTTIKFCVLPKLQYDFQLDSADGRTVKETILSKFKFVPMFGTDYEGFIVELPDHTLVKAVDRTKFNGLKNLNWNYINLATRLKTKFKNKTKKNVSNIKANLKEWLAELEIIQKEFLETGRHTLTIKKKVRDTIKYFDYNKLEIIKPLLERLRSGESEADVFQAFLDKKYTIKIETIKEGHTTLFKEVNSYTPKQLVRCNVNQTMDMIGFTFWGTVVGNRDKEFLGDLDVALESGYFEVHFNVDSCDIWEPISKQLSSIPDLKYNICKGLKQVHILKPLCDEEGRHINGFDKDGNQINELGYIQVDLFIGSVYWMQDILSGAPDDSAYKASYRNVLFRSIVEGVSAPFSDGLRTLTVDWKVGLKAYNEHIVPPRAGSKSYTRKKVKTNEELVTQNSDELASFFFGPGKSWLDVESFEKMYEAYMSDTFRYPQFRHVIDQLLLINMSECKLKIPEFLCVSSI